MKLLNHYHKFVDIYFLQNLKQNIATIMSSLFYINSLLINDFFSFLLKK
jgi:hypothetical protein